MKKLTAILSVFVLASAAMGQMVSNISCVQRWPWNGLVDIEFTLASENNNGMPVFDLAYYGKIGDGTPFPIKTLLGEGASRIAIGEGAHRVTWDAYADCGASVDAGNVKVAVVARESAMPPKYLILDLQTYQILESWTDPSPSDNATKQTQIWFRRIEPGTFTMGASSDDRAYFNVGMNNETVHEVTITKPFYISVYETTEAQYAKIDSETSDSSMLPKTGLDYTDIRGENVGTNWPGLGHAVDSDSFLGKLRAKTGHEVVFDLPTEAQWEMAARSKGDGTFYGDLHWTDGSSYAKVDGNVNQDTNLFRLAWYKSTIHEVGLKEPSSIGLYDVHGNVWEWCLDWTIDNLGTAPVTDPVGPLHQKNNSGQRMRRGGAASNAPGEMRIARRNAASPTSTHADYGFRMVIIVGE
ncbi:formylglycine-generating enzyme family protein [bacterium]|nr:formylglycine-generating enzyme family protein [bacterium]